MENLPHPTIVIAAWNRPHSLQRLLTGLERGHYPAGTKLHISIDFFEYADVQDLATSFVWPHGEKVVEMHPQRLGLRQHILYCGGLTAQYGSIILLEDDLAVSPFAYAYTQQALAYFQENQDVAGISLYACGVAESCLQPFYPWMDAFDNWFLQLPSSWGAAFTGTQWLAFEDWLSVHFQHLPALPDYVSTWTDQSWKKLFTAYLIATNRFFAYPRFSLTTNFEDFGAHANTQGLFQVPLLMGNREWKFGPLADSLAVYDAHFEILPEKLKQIAPDLAAYDFAVDLLGQKRGKFLDRPWVLTRKKGGKPERSFGGHALPLELNIQLKSPGDSFLLVPSNADLTAPDDLQIEFDYYSGPTKSALIHLPARRMPSVSWIVTSVDDSQDSQLLESLLDENYPGIEIIVVVSSGKMPNVVWSAYKTGKIRVVESDGTVFEGVQKAVKASTGQLIQVVDVEFYPSTNILIKIAEVFKQFPGLDWLTGLPFQNDGTTLSRVMAPLRWDSDRFQSASAEDIAAFLPVPLQIFRRALWFKVQTVEATLEGQFRQMGLIALPQISTLEIGEWIRQQPEPRKSTWGAGKINRSRVFYHRHIPLLWKLHRRWSDYRPVIRYDGDNQTWFEFDY
jgi:hypothetical protein